MKISKESVSEAVKTGPLVSIIMPTYAGDNERHLRHAVRCMLDQDYPHVELVLIVDGPVPSERSQVLQNIATDSRVRLLNVEKNSGPAHARNVGIAQAAGEFIAIMDADDTAKPDRISHQLEAIRSSGLDVISSDLEIINHEGELIGFRTLPTEHGAIKASAPFRCPLHNGSLFAKASVLKDNPYNTSHRVGEDYELWVRLIRKGYQLGNTSYRCVAYRQSPADVVKRKGLRYAVSDFKIKVGAVPLASFPKKPFVVAVAVGTAIARLLPMPMFSKLYARREQFLAILR
jgi:glycosyltransferase involved in cell wall biosynthesis